MGPMIRDFGLAFLASEQPWFVLQFHAAQNLRFWTGKYNAILQYARLVCNDNYQQWLYCMVWLHAIRSTTMARWWRTRKREGLMNWCQPVFRHSSLYSWISLTTELLFWVNTSLTVCCAVAVSTSFTVYCILSVVLSDVLWLWAPVLQPAVLCCLLCCGCEHQLYNLLCCTVLLWCEHQFYSQLYCTVCCAVAVSTSFTVYCKSVVSTNFAVCSAVAVNTSFTA